MLADDPEDGVSVGVASGWRQGVDLMMDPKEMAQAAGVDSSNAGAVDPNNPLQKLTSDLEQQSKQDEMQQLAGLRAKGVAIQVLDGSKQTIGELRTRYRVIVIDHGGNYDLEKATADEMDALRGDGASDPQKITLPIGPAVKIVAERKTIGGDTEDRISYVVVDGKKSYHLRFQCTNNPSAIQSIADDVAKTWRITPSKS